MTFFLSKNLYGKHPFYRLDAYHMAPGWLFLKAGSWTLEVEYDENVFPRLLAALKVRRGQPKETRSNP